VPWQSTGGLISLAAVVIGGGLVLLARIKQRGVRTDKRSETRSATKQPVSTEIASARAAASELRQLAEELASMLDAKSQHLESLIARADAQLARLERTTLAPRATERDAAAIAEPKHRPATPAPNASHAEVHRLADQGLTPVEIARQIGKPTGTVELILNLRRVAARGA
jgi:hypothetical protein